MSEVGQGAFLSGFEERRLYGLLWRENLYRRPWWRRALWLVGWACAAPFFPSRVWRGR